MSSHSLQVAQVITPSRMAGAETLLARLVPRQRERGHAVDVVCSHRSPAIGDLRAAGLSPHLLRLSGKIGLRSWWNLRGFAAERPGIVLHSHLSTASWWCGWLDRLSDVPTIGHVHGFTSARWHRHQRRLIACSHAVADHLVEKGIPRRRITVLHNPVDPQDVCVNRDAFSVRAELSTPRNARVVATLAHFSVKKGWRELIPAALQVVKEHPETYFWCLGDGPLREEMQQLVVAAGCEQNFRFTGFRRDAPDLLGAADIMALPSHREPFGLVYVEAGLLAKPVIACDAGGASEVVEHGGNGLLAPPKQPHCLKDAIAQLVTNADYARRLGEAGEQRARERFSWEVFLQGLDDVYTTVAANVQAA